MVNKKKTGLNGNKSEKSLRNDIPKFSHDKSWAALLNAQDTLERCLIPFVLLEDTAEQVFKNKANLELKEISVGVQRRHMTETGKEMLMTIVPDIIDAKVSMGYEHEGVPIVIWVIQRNYKFFQHPDSVFYGIENFFVPNPFESYWRARFLVK